MTGEQYKLYRTRMRIGRTFPVGGTTWTIFRPDSADGVTSAATLTNQGTATLYITEGELSQWGQPLPPQPVGVVPFRMDAPVGTDILAGDVVSNGSRAFSIGPLDQYQGFPSAICTITGAPTFRSVRTGMGYQQGLRIGAF